MSDGVAVPDATEVAARLGPLMRRPVVRHAVELLGSPGSRRAIATPALVVDADALERNIDTARRHAGAAGVGLRPHAKTHKCAAIARRQLDAGAAGICVAKVGEAEALAAAGIDRLLVTSPVHAGLVERVAALRAAGTDVTVVLDDTDAVAPLARAVVGVAGLDVLVDVDVGMHRSGVAGPDRAAGLAEQIRAQPSLRLRGVQGYGGHWQHVPDPSARRAAVAEGMVVLSRCAQAVDAGGSGGSRSEVRTGGGTGTFAIDRELGVLNDLQLGSYVLMDGQYEDALATDEGPRWDQALFVQATVVSAVHDTFVTVDAGLKAFATDAGVPRTPASTYAWFGDEHGLLTRPADRVLAVGDRVELVPPHCDPTVDRYDVMHLVRGDVLVDVVPVDARGCSQ
jgi:D-serine deaminase-like pyridoxal phosphate-dependent protein